MKRITLLGALLAVGAIALASTAAAGPALPGITGGGVSQNDNSGAGTLRTTTGFSAWASAAGVAQNHTFFAATPIVVYPAKGQVQGKNSQASGPSSSISSYHGDVVCIADLGPSSGVDGGGNPAADVWEIRFRITQARDADNKRIALPPFPIYGSYFVQDDGKTDYQDENFGVAFITNPACGVVPFFQLESQLQGSITVHE